MDDTARRIGQNEALFREVNERVQDVVVGFGEGLPDAEFICECGHRDCTERIPMTLDEYEHVRAEPTTFLVKKGHDLPDVETVVEEHEAYVVRKHPGATAALAAETDPRA